MNYKKIAGTILCFDRPDYTKKVVESLEKANESSDIDWYVFQDGMENRISGNIYGNEDDLEEVSNIIKNSSLNIKEFAQNKYNLSVAQQKYRAHQLFNEYDLIFFFEDDLVVGKHYLSLLKKLAEQFPDKIGTMFCHPSRKNESALEFVEPYYIARLWGYYMNRLVYNNIKDEYNRFYNEIKKVDYNIKWQTPKLGQIVNFPWMCHDITITRLSRKKGHHKLNPRVTRANYIGKNGALAYRTESTWLDRNLHKQPTKITYSQDKRRDKFRLIWKDK